ncbi:unnamed protein product [Arabidopsis lyrata]|nr:unnamed protein product [Arabidopsis lyrata]
MLDIITGVSQCEREHAEHQMKLDDEAQITAAKSEPETEGPPS